MSDESYDFPHQTSVLLDDTGLAVPLDPAVELAIPVPAASVAAPRKPRVWTVFAVYVLAFAAVIGVQIVLAIGMLMWFVQQGMGVQQAAARLIETATTPGFFIAMGIPTQLLLLLTSLAAGWCSPKPMINRLGLSWPRASLWTMSFWLIGTLVPFAVGIGAAHLLAELIPPDPTAARLYEKMHWGIAPGFILFIALAPGLAEELLFRGYIQRRLSARWPVWVSILVTSLLFGVMHLMPHTVIFAFILGIWFGLMAWRTSSIWPSALGHALVNGLWNVWQVGKSLDVFPAEFPWPLLIAIAVVGLAGFAAACWDLGRHWSSSNVRSEV